MNSTSADGTHLRPTGKYRRYEGDVPASLATLWAFLLDREYDVDYVYDEKCFGNELIHFQKSGVAVQVRIVQDKSLWNFFIGSREQDVWSGRKAWFSVSTPP